MKRLISASVIVGLFCLPSTTQALTPVNALSKSVSEYQKFYKEVASKFGKQTPGRNIARWGMSNGQTATDADLAQSIGVLKGMLAPPPAPVSAPAASTTSPAPSGGTSALASCIIAHESGGDPQAVSPGGTYEGIGQWSSTAWAQDGGTQYAPTPLEASYAEQLSVLNSEGAAGMESQQGQYDGC